MTPTDTADAVAGPSESRSRLIGREAELESLRATITAALRAADPRFFTVMGPAGIGKSRFISELVAELCDDPATLPRVFRGSAPSNAETCGAFSRLLRARFGLREAMSGEASIAQLRGQVLSVLEDRRVDDVCLLLGQMLGLSVRDTMVTPAPVHDSDREAELRRSILKRFVNADAALGPLVLVLEDLHSADEASIELASHLMDDLDGPVILLLSARTEFVDRHPGWANAGGARHRIVELLPLRQQQATLVMRSLLSPCEGGVPDPLVETATRLARGNPGALERMVRLYLEAGVLKESGIMGPESWRVNLEKLGSIRLPELRLPELRLPEKDEAASTTAVGELTLSERRLLEYAAAMGSVFWLGGLVALARQDAAVPEFWRADEQADIEDMIATLDGLVERDHVLKLPDSTFPGETEYIFKHTQKREEFAASISPAVAHRHHETLVGWLAQKEAIHSQEDHCLMLAEHLERSGNRLGAAHALLGAGDLAAAHLAPNRAEEHYRKGLEFLGSSDARRRIDALHHRGTVLAILGRQDEALGSFREMLGLAFRFGLLPKGGAAHDGMGRIHRDLGALNEATQHFETALGLCEASGDRRGVATCHDDLGQLSWIKGEYEQALRHTQLGLDLRTALGDQRAVALSLGHLGGILLDHGQPAQAREAVEGALRLRREIQDPMGTADSLTDLARLCRDEGAHAQALSHLREAQAIAADAGDASRTAKVLCAMGQTHRRLGEADRALQLLKEAETASEQLGDKLNLAEVRRELARVYLGQGELRPAREAIKSAVDLLGHLKSKPLLGPAIRTLGQVTAAGAWGKEHQGRAVEYFMRSITLSKELGNELELAKSYKAFAEYVLGSEQYRNDADIQREAHKVSGVADEIFERRRRAL